MIYSVESFFDIKCGETNGFSSRCIVKGCEPFLS